MSSVSPYQVLHEVSAAIPEHCRQNIVVIGSLAAGYHFFKNDQTKAVRTKDVDCVLEPFHVAVEKGQCIARQLLDGGWQRRMLGEHQNPGTENTPEEQLPAVRLYPPGVNPETDDKAWFIELLTVPASNDVSGKVWTRLPLEEGHFGLPTFRFLSVTAFKPLLIEDLGIRYAQPEMMALANLLEHPKIKPERMSGLIAGRSFKRSNKDLGRVLAIATLADLNDYLPWGKIWLHALQNCFPEEWPELARRAGTGMRELMESDTDFEEAYQTCLNGLLASQPPTEKALRAAGLRVVGEALDYLEKIA